jgi:hypothetical protein
MKKYAFYIVLVFTFIASVYAYFQFLKPLDVFLWDESHHGFYGMQIYNDLRTFDLGAFWAHTNNQALWMPLHSWFDGIFLLIFGFSYTSARLSSLFLFFLCSILVYLIGQELSKDKGWLIGLVSCVLFLTSPMMLHLATVNMQEMLGIFMILLITYFITRYISVEEIWKYITIGFLLGVTYWTKQNYAIQAVIGIGLFHISEFPGNDKNRLAAAKKWIINGLLIIAGLLPLFILWWAMPPFSRKYSLAVTFRQGSVAGANTSFISNTVGTMLFYVQSLITSYNLSFWIGVLSLASFIASSFYYKDKKLRVISLMFLANLSFISILSFAQERYISTAQPLMFLLLGYFCVIIYERIKHQKYALYIYALALFVIASFAFDLTSLTNYTKEVANRSMLSLIYKDSLNKYSPPFLFGLAKRPAFTYPVSIDQKKKYADFKVPPGSTIQDILNYFSSNIEKNRSISTMISFNELSPYVIYWHFHDWGAPVMSVNDLGFNPRYFWMADYFLDIQASDDSPYYSDLLDKKWNDVSNVLLKEGVIRMAAKKEFSDLGLTAKIYKREKLFYFK